MSDINLLLEQTRIAAQLATIESFTGWLSLCFALTMANGNPHAVLFRIAEHSTDRAMWVIGFFLLGLSLIIAAHFFRRRLRFFQASFGCIFYSFFAAQAVAVGALGAALMSAVVVGHLYYCAHRFHSHE